MYCGRYICVSVFAILWQLPHSTATAVCYRQPHPEKKRRVFIHTSPPFTCSFANKPLNECLPLGGSNKVRKRKGCFPNVNHLGLKMQSFPPGRKNILVINWEWHVFLLICASFPKAKALLSLQTKPTPYWGGEQSPPWSPACGPCFNERTGRNELCLTDTNFIN